MIKELHLFKVRSDSFVYPLFYVEAIDILEATKLAKEIIDSLNNKRTISIISTEDEPLLKLEEG